MCQRPIVRAARFKERAKTLEEVASRVDVPVPREVAVMDTLFFAMAATKGLYRRIQRCRGGDRQTDKIEAAGRSPIGRGAG